jgi:putative tricarboxylic transport membrane protein
MKLSDALSGLLLAALGIALLIYARGLPLIPGQQVGPGFFPGAVALGLIAAGLVLALATLRRRAGGAWLELDEWVRNPRALRAMAVTVVSLGCYVALADRLGYFLTAPPVLAAILAAFGVRPAALVPVALAVPALIHYIFYSILKVPLPWGVLTPYAW